MKKIVLICYIFLSSLSYANEPSVYGAGNIDSDNPYGLTKTEQNVLVNRRTIQNLKNRVEEQQNRIDGLITIIDGLNKKVLTLKEDISINANRIRKNSDNNKTYSLLLELGKMVDDINKNYISRDELKEALSEISRTVQREIRTVQKEIASLSKNKSHPTNDNISPNANDNISMNNINNSIFSDDDMSINNSISPDDDISINNNISSNDDMSIYDNISSNDDISTIYRQAIQLFIQKSYNASKEKFEEVLSKNYKLASTNYYLGEIAYFTLNYPEAIRYYKKSASLYNNASYMPILYLHTAIALEKNGQSEQARNFFQFVVDSYPNTKAADIAKKNL